MYYLSTNDLKSVINENKSRYNLYGTPTKQSVPTHSP